MKRVTISLMLLLMMTAVQAQRSYCVKRFLPHPERTKTERAATRAVVGNPKTYTGERRGLIILMEFQDVKFNNISASSLEGRR